MNTPTPGAEQVQAHLAALRELVEQARPMPMSSSVMVNRSEVLARLGELEASLDTATLEATALVGRQADLVQASRLEAEMILRDARMEQERLVGDTEVYRIALREADELRTRAAEDAAALRRDTDAYVDQRLGSFQVTLEQTMEAVARGRERLADAHARSHAFDHDDDVRDDVRDDERDDHSDDHRQGALGWPGGLDGTSRPPGPAQAAG